MLGAEPAVGHSHSGTVASVPMAVPSRPPVLLGLQSAWARGPEDLALAQGCKLRAERAQLWAWAGAGARAADGVLFFIWVVTGV